MRVWLQQTLQLQPRALFPSASEAANGFLDVLAGSSGRRAGAQALQMAIRVMCGEVVTLTAPEPAPRPAAVPVEAPRPAEAPSRAFSLLRAVLPHFRAN